MLNNWPTRIAIGHTTKITGNVRFKGFDEVFYFLEDEFLSWVENDEYLTQSMKDTLRNLLKQK